MLDSGINKKRLSRLQLSVLNLLEEGVSIYVFPSEKGYSFGMSTTDTSNRLYLTLSCRSLVERGLCEVNLFEYSNSTDTSVGTLVRKFE